MNDDGVPGDPGVVVGDVEAAELGDDGVDHRRDRGLIADVDLERDARAAGLLDRRRNACCGAAVPVDHGDPGALDREEHRSRLADPAATTGHERGLARHHSLEP